MLGLNYDSDEEAPAEEPVKAPTPAPKAAPKATPAPKQGAKGAGKGKGKPSTPRAKQIPAAKLKELRKEVLGAKSATGVVQASRKAIDILWDPRWGAEALYQIAKRSTARTRKEWQGDPFVKKLAEKLTGEVTAFTEKDAARREGDVDSLLVALDGLRRMSFQDSIDQKDALEQAIGWVAADDWHHPVKSLSRLFWLAAPLKLKGDLWGDVPGRIRSKAVLLEGPDLALLVDAMQYASSKDDALLEKVVGKLKSADAYTGLSATDLVEIAEGLNALGMGEEAVLRPLGQETLRRRGELTPDESHRVHTAYSAMKLPLPKVWAEPGASKKRDGGQIVTTTAFAPQEGHEKKRRGNHDIEKTSPPRVVRDMKMMSY